MSQNRVLSISKWDEYHQQIERLVESGDIKNFLQWYPILRAVAVGNAKHIRHKIMWLRNLTNWKHIREVINESWVGNPSPLPQFEFTSGTRVNMMYHVMQLKIKMGIDLSSYDEILEFGGGYGCMCDILRIMGFDGNYQIYDLPVMGKIQEYFLSANSHTNFRCVSSVDQIVKPAGNAAFIATMSFSETQVESRRMIEEILPRYNLIFIAYADKFFDIDNRRYFDQLCKQLSDYKWGTWHIDADLPVVREGKRYLVGVKHE